VIVTDAVETYLTSLRRSPDDVLAEMEDQAEHEHIPVVEPVTGALLHVLARAIGAEQVVEVGTAIGVSTLYLARALPPGGRIVSFEIDPDRRADAHRYLERAGLLERVDLRLEPGLEGLAKLPGPFDLAFVDAVKLEYGGYLEAVIPLLRPGGLVVVDNTLMSGTVAENETDGHWTAQQIASARAVNETLVFHPDLSGTVTPIGDGVGIAVKLR
jgi:predicted O-methyltransferase YrrM